MIGTSAGVAASLLHGYLFSKMAASREPVARFWGPIPWHRGTFLVRFIRTQPYGGSGLYIRSCFC